MQQLNFLPFPTVSPEKASTFAREMLYVNALVIRFRLLSHQKTGNG
jgi:hypothetical protein